MRMDYFHELHMAHLLWLAGTEGGKRLRLVGEDLSNTNLSQLNLSRAIFYSCNFSYSRLDAANLRLARFDNCCFAGAQLDRANLDGVVATPNCSFFHLTPPEEGSYIGWKKAREGYIVKLRITEGALRSSATSRKCRASEAIVLSIEKELDNGEVEHINEISSMWNYDFVYEVGKYVRVPYFDTNRWRECSTGIHHFLTKQEAITYA